MTATLVTLLHLCDSQFPIGAFAHSDGLEAATACGAIANAADLADWLGTLLSETLRFSEGLAVRRSAEWFDSGRVSALVALDDELDAMRPSSAGREASRAMGYRLLQTWQQLRPAAALASLTPQRRFTLPVAFGIVAAVSSIDRRDAVEGYLYTRLAASVSAAMRLMAIGQQRGHQLLADCLARVPETATAILADEGPLRAFTPAMDIAAMSHQYVHSRLFRS